MRSNPISQLAHRPCLSESALARPGPASAESDHASSATNSSSAVDTRMTDCEAGSGRGVEQEKKNKRKNKKKKRVSIRMRVQIHIRDIIDSGVRSYMSTKFASLIAHCVF